MVTSAPAAAAPGRRRSFEVVRVGGGSHARLRCLPVLNHHSKKGHTSTQVGQRRRRQASLRFSRRIPLGSHRSGRFRVHLPHLADDTSCRRPDAHRHRQDQGRPVSTAARNVQARPAHAGWVAARSACRSRVCCNDRERPATGSARPPSKSEDQRDAHDATRTVVDGMHCCDLGRPRGRGAGRLGRIVLATEPSAASSETRCSRLGCRTDVEGDRGWETCDHPDPWAHKRADPNPHQPQRRAGRRREAW
jgi:hypothetical protein